jgi:hypothetical protein
MNTLRWSIKDAFDCAEKELQQLKLQSLFVYIDCRDRMYLEAGGIRITSDYRQARLYAVGKVCRLSLSNDQLTENWE